MKLLDIIEGAQVLLWDDGSIHFTTHARIDGDGAGAPHGDPDFQSNTSLHYNGQPLNADTDFYIAISPDVCREVGPTVLGCQAWLLNQYNGKRARAVVADIGPHRKLGEISCALATMLGIDPSPTKGGEDAHIIEYILQPGVPAKAQGRVYTLLPLGR